MSDERRERERRRSLISPNMVSQLSSYLVQGDCSWGKTLKIQCKHYSSPIMLTNIKLLFATSGCDIRTQSVPLWAYFSSSSVDPSQHLSTHHINMFYSGAKCNYLFTLFIRHLARARICQSWQIALGEYSVGWIHTFMVITLIITHNSSHSTSTRITPMRRVTSHLSSIFSTSSKSRH